MRIQRYIAKDMRSALRRCARPWAPRRSSCRPAPSVTRSKWSPRSTWKSRSSTRRRAAPPQVDAARQNHRSAPLRRASSQLSEALVPKAPRRCRARRSPRAAAAARSSTVTRQRSQRHAPHARNAARDARVERHVAALAAAGRDAQGAHGARHRAGSRRLAGAQDSRQPEFFRGAALRARDHRAHRAGHRRALARDRRPHRLRRSRRRRQDHLDSQARRPLGAASWSARAWRWCRPTRCASARRSRCTRWDACSASRRTRSTTSPNCRNCWTRCPASAGADRHRGREPARSGSRAPPAPARPGESTHRNLVWCFRPHQAGAIEEAMKRFAVARPSSCVITKLDEAASLGGALSALIRTSCRSPTSATASACPKICSPRARISWWPRGGDRAAATARPRMTKSCSDASRESAHGRPIRHSHELDGVVRAHNPPVQVIAVTGGKGGVGKTSVAVNLATALAARGKRVMLLDGDLGLANVDVFLGLSPRHTMAHVLSGERTLEEIILESPQGFKSCRAPRASPSSQSRAAAPRPGAGVQHAHRPVDVLIVDTSAGHLAQRAAVLAGGAARAGGGVRRTGVDDRCLRAHQGAESQPWRQQFRVLANMVRGRGKGQALFQKLRARDRPVPGRDPGIRWGNP